MNKRRRKEIRAVVEKLNCIMDNIKSGCQIDMDMLGDIICDLDCIFCDEEYYRDNIPENLQESIRYYAADEACDNIEEAIDGLNYIAEDDSMEYIIQTISESITCLQDAIR